MQIGHFTGKSTSGSAISHTAPLHSVIGHPSRAAEAASPLRKPRASHYDPNIARRKLLQCETTLVIDCAPSSVKLSADVLSQHADLPLMDDWQTMTFHVRSCRSLYCVLMPAGAA
jgi:hypothetical protein